MRQPILEQAIVGNSLIPIVEYTGPLLSPIHILPHILDPILILIHSLPMLLVILVLPNIVSNRLLSQFPFNYNQQLTSINKLPILVELALIDILDFILSPFHRSLNFMSLVVCADELVTVFRVGLLAMAVEEVVLELALVLEPL